MTNFEGCMISEESYGCTGIGTAIEANGLGVLLILHLNCFAPHYE